MNSCFWPSQRTLDADANRSWDGSLAEDPTDLGVAVDLLVTSEVLGLAALDLAALGEMTVLLLGLARLALVLGHGGILDLDTLALTWTLNQVNSVLIKLLHLPCRRPGSSCFQDHHTGPWRRRRGRKLRKVSWLLLRNKGRKVQLGTYKASIVMHWSHRFWFDNCLFRVMITQN